MKDRAFLWAKNMPMYNDTSAVAKIKKQWISRLDSPQYLRCPSSPLYVLHIDHGFYETGHKSTQSASQKL